MSLNVTLILEDANVSTGSGIFVREDGQIKEISRKEWDSKFPGTEPVIAEMDDSSDYVYDANITHNLARMADKAGLYQYLWRPDEVKITKANQLITPLQLGLERLKNDPEFFKQFNSSNRWGNYENLVNFTERYLEACKQYPEASIYVSR